MKLFNKDTSTLKSVDITEFMAKAEETFKHFPDGYVVVYELDDASPIRPKKLTIMLERFLSLPGMGYDYIQEKAGDGEYELHLYADHKTRQAKTDIAVGDPRKKDKKQASETARSSGVIKDVMPLLEKAFDKIMGGSTLQDKVIEQLLQKNLQSEGGSPESYFSMFIQMFEFIKSLQPEVQQDLLGSAINALPALAQLFRPGQSQPALAMQPQLGATPALAAPGAYTSAPQPPGVIPPPVPLLNPANSIAPAAANPRQVFFEELKITPFREALQKGWANADEIRESIMDMVNDSLNLNQPDRHPAVAAMCDAFESQQVILKGPAAIQQFFDSVPELKGNLALCQSVKRSFLSIIAHIGQEVMRQGQMDKGEVEMPEVPPDPEEEAGT